MSASTEIEDLTHEIRALLSQSDAADAERVYRLAKRYNDACENINKRLASATSLLREGLISEMRHAVETYPDALESAGHLELGDKRDSWLKLCEINGVPVIGPRTELSTELVRSYAEHEKLAPLIRSHRLLAISYAPLTDRIGVLRRLIIADGLNPSWRAQLSALESARDEQIEEHARQAAARSDSSALEKLLEELRSADRKSKASPSLVDFVNRCRESVQRHLAAQRRVEIADLVHECRSKTDWERCHELIQEYDSLGRIPGVQTPDQVAAAVESVRDWADSNHTEAERNRQFLIACETLDRMLDDGADYREIDRQYALIQRTEIPVAKTIEQRFLQRRRQLMLERARRHRIVAVLTIGIVVISAFIVIRITNQRALDAKAETWIASMQKVLDDSDFDAAASMVHKLRSEETDIASVPRIIALLERADRSIAQEQIRRSEFVSALNNMKGLKGFDHQAPAAIARAKGLVRGDAEMHLFSVERERLTVESMSDQETRDEPFRRARAVISSAVSDASTLSGPPKALALRQAAKRFDELLLTKGVSETELRITRTERDAAVAEAVTIEQAEERRLELALQLERLPAAATSVPTLITAYEDLINRFPESAPAMKLNSVLGNRGAWNLIDSMNVMTRMWSESVIPRTKEDCVSRALEIETLLGKITKAPDAVILGEYLDLIKHFCAQDAAPREALNIDAVRNVLERDWISDLQFARDDTGRIFYTRRGMTKSIPGGFYSLTNHVSKLEHLIDDSASTPSAILRCESEPTLQPAPINVLGQELLRIIRTSDDSNIDSIHLQLAGAIARDLETDPILRLILISDVLGNHVESGRPADPAVTRFAREASTIAVQGRKIVDMNWTDTAGEVTKRGRELAEEILRKAPDFRAVSAAWTSRRAALKQSFDGIVPFGVVWIDDSGAPIVRFVRPPHPDKFYVVTGNDQTATFSETGAVDPTGAVTFLSNMPDPGTPVFMRQVQPR